MRGSIGARSNYNTVEEHIRAQVINRNKVDEKVVSQKEQTQQVVDLAKDQDIRSCRRVYRNSSNLAEANEAGIVFDQSRHDI